MQDLHVYDVVKHKKSSNYYSSNALTEIDFNIKFQTLFEKSTPLLYK